MNSIDSPQKINIKPGPYLLDHCVIEFVVEINKPKVNYHEVKFRNFKAVDTTKMVQDMHLGKVKGNSTDALLLNLDYSIRQALKIHAPVKEKLLHNRNGKPWYDEELRSQHHVCETVKISGKNI